MSTDERPPLRRRAFLGAVAARAAYVAPAVIAMSASRRAGAGGPSCGDATSPCAVDGDCCGGLTCQKLNAMGMWVACAGMMGCECRV